MIDVNEIRKNFPVTKNLIYLDHAAVAPLHNASKAVLEEYTEHFLNQGIKNYTYWYEKTEKIRENFAKFIGADPSEIAFIKSTSAGLSIFANGINFKEGDNIIIPEIEFPSNVYPWLNLQKKGVNVKFLNCDNGIIDTCKLESLIDEKTRVVSVSWVQFTNGYKADLAQISKICHNKSNQYGRKIYFCVDAIQGLGALKLEVNEIDIDFLAADGHKWFLAAEGAGFLYCNKNILDEIHPVTVGWKSVINPLDFTNIHFDLEKSAKKFEEGSMNLPGILTLGASLELFNKYGINNIENRILSLSKYACTLLEKKNIELLTINEDFCRSGIISFKTKNINADFEKLVQQNIQVSKRGNALRISPHVYNTVHEIENFVDNL
ncbi:MAG: aminotransferase class V-fold PLP-dependent enzyme [bacterium]